MLVSLIIVIKIILIHFEFKIFLYKLNPYESQDIKYIKKFISCPYRSDALVHLSLKNPLSI